MDKIKIDTGAFGFPMPVVLIGANVAGKANFMAVAWVCKVNYKPLIIGASINKRQYTGEGIIENETFSINVPGTYLVELTDHCGLVSGRNTDKSELFDVFYGDLKTAPMVKQCPLCAECKLVDTYSTETNNFFHGEVVSVYSEEKYLSEGALDNSKTDLFVLVMPEMNYIKLGEPIGKAWEIGKKLVKD